MYQHHFWFLISMALKVSFCSGFNNLINLKKRCQESLSEWGQKTLEDNRHYHRTKGECTPEDSSIDWRRIRWEEVGVQKEFNEGEREQAAKQFQEWFRNFLIPRSERPAVLVQTSSADRGFGLFATRDIMADQILVEVPYALTINGDTLPTPLQERINKNDVAVPACAALNLIYQRSLGKDSALENYINVLPRGYPELPVFWPVHKLKFLNGTMVYDDCMQLRAVLVAEFSNVMHPIRQEIDPRFALEDWCWARATVLSRAYHIGDSYRLCPLIDMCNHKNSVKSAVLGGDGIFAERSSSLLVAEQAYSKGDEIWSNYGVQFNWQKLFAFGYTDNTKVPLNGAFELKIGVGPVHMHGERQDLLKALKKHGLQTKCCFNICLQQSEVETPLQNGISFNSFTDVHLLSVYTTIQKILPAARLAVLSKEFKVVDALIEEVAAQDLLQFSVEEIAQTLLSFLYNRISPVNEKQAFNLIIKLCLQKLNVVSQTLAYIQKRNDNLQSGQCSELHEKFINDCTIVCAGEIFTLQVVIGALLQENV